MANNELRRRRSKKAQILAYLLGGGTLTSLQAQDIFGTQKLATRISELINKDGHAEIEKKSVWVEDRDGEMVKVTRYSIPPEVRAAL